MNNIIAVSCIAILFINAATSEDCHKCVRKAECSAYGNLNKLDQDAWLLKYPCTGAGDESYSKLFGFSSTAKGDFVCCSEAIANASKVSVDSRHPDYNNYGYPNYNGVNNNPNNYPNSQNPNYYNQGNNRLPNNRWGNNNFGYNPSQGNPPYNGYQPGVNRQPPNNYFNGNNNNNPYVTQNPFYGYGRGDMGGSSNQGGQCPVTSFAPKPETGCCGREATDSDRIIGGRETELEQFPWLVLLLVTFDDGQKRTGFNCGGSLLSSKFVLTAGHCVFEKGSSVADIDIYLAEFDKRTFPKDCKVVLGQGKKCIENIVMKAENIILHPQYDDTRLKNDIAMIKIQGNAPYTDFIRPICLPSIDIDSPDFFNLRLAVAGWGRNGRYRSDIKQSTIVNLVPQEKCVKFYPNLSRRQMCAAGYTGEDTCKGDSGGPLMTVYGGKYEVVGVVSGKRADSPCGTSVPSLYTNVYHYREWIESSMMRNP